MERRFHLVRAGLSHHLDEALQDQALCEVLGHPNHSSETKRIVAAAFQRGLWQGETTQICRRLEHFNSNSTLAHRCLDAHFRRCSEQFESDLLGMNVSYNKAHASSLRT